MNIFMLLAVSGAEASSVVPQTKLLGEKIYVCVLNGQIALSVC